MYFMIFVQVDVLGLDFTLAELENLFLCTWTLDTTLEVL